MTRLSHSVLVSWALFLLAPPWAGAQEFKGPDLSEFKTVETAITTRLAKTVVPQVTSPGYLGVSVSLEDGGKLVVGSTRAGYGRISKETVLAQNPDIIFDIMPASQSSIGPHPESAWGELPEINAVRHGQVHVIRDDFVPHDSQMIGRTAALFAHLLHPEVPEREWEPR